LLPPDGRLPPSLVSLDVGASEWTADALVRFLTGVCQEGSKLPLALKLDRSRLNCSWHEPLSRLPLDLLKPVITELDLTGNEIDNVSISGLLAFLNTQSPLLTQSAHKLTYLSVSDCFHTNVPNCVQLLMEFLGKRELWGLAIGDTCDENKADIVNVLIEQLRQIEGLTSLDLTGNFLQESAVTSLLEFLRDSPSIAEIAYDRSGITNPDQMLYLYENLVSSHHILAVNRPISDLKPIAHWAEAKRIQARLANRRSFATPQQRLSLYLSLFGDFEARVVPPCIWPDVETGEDEPLVDVPFVNRIPSLIMAASRPSEAGVDPLAAMVVEYVATTGKFGIVPPTAPPPDSAPATPLQFPAVFGTIAPTCEIMQHEEVNLAQIAAELAPTMLAAGGKIPSIFSDFPPVNPREVGIAPLIRFA
jgi:hypothetical protein